MTCCEPQRSEVVLEFSWGIVSAPAFIPKKSLLPPPHSISTVTAISSAAQPTDFHASTNRAVGSSLPSQSSILFNQQILFVKTNKKIKNVQLFSVFAQKQNCQNPIIRMLRRKKEVQNDQKIGLRNMWMIPNQVWWLLLSTRYFLKYLDILKSVLRRCNYPFTSQTTQDILGICSFSRYKWLSIRSYLTGKKVVITGRTSCGVDHETGLLLASGSLFHPNAVQTDPGAGLDGVAEVDVEPAVNERIVADGRHGQPVTDEESGGIVPGRSGRCRHVAHQVVHVQRQPAQREQRYDHQQHLDRFAFGPILTAPLRVRHSAHERAHPQLEPVH